MSRRAPKPRLPYPPSDAVRAELEIECANPEIVVRSIKPDMVEHEKFSADIKAMKDKVVLKVESKEIVGLLAGINSYVRLIKTSTDVSNLEE